VVNPQVEAPAFARVSADDDWPSAQLVGAGVLLVFIVAIATVAKRRLRRARRVGPVQAEFTQR
jgi:hypothetical protein